MADYVMLRRGRNALSSVTHVVLNIVLALTSTTLTVISGSWILAVALVLLSKWRVMAVRPRYWWLNIKANLVDYTVSISLALLVYLAGTEGLNVWHVILTIFYIAWLIFIKPQSEGIWPEIQALCAVFFGTFATAIISATNPPLASCMICFVIGYGASRHVLTQGDDHDFTLTTFIFGLMLAELNWIFYHWTITYSMLGQSALRLPQLSIVSTIMSFVFFRGYKSALYHDGKIRADDILLPALFSVVLMIVMLLFFSEPIFDV